MTPAETRCPEDRIRLWALGAKKEPPNGHAGPSGRLAIASEYGAAICDFNR